MECWSQKSREVVWWEGPVGWVLHAPGFSPSSTIWQISRVFFSCQLILHHLSGSEINYGKSCCTCRQFKSCSPTHTPSAPSKLVLGDKRGTFTIERLGQWLGEEAVRSCQHPSSMAFKKPEMTLSSSWVKCEFKAIAHSLWVNDWWGIGGLGGNRQYSPVPFSTRKELTKGRVADGSSWR